MQCKVHGLSCTATNQFGRSFCFLCRELKKQLPEDQERINNWRAQHKALLATKSSSAFSLRISDLHVRTEDENGEPRLGPSEAIKGNVEADFFDHLRSKRAPEPEWGDLRVCIAPINNGSVRSAALKYGLSPSLVYRVRVDWKTKGVRPATERLLNHARRSLAKGNAVGMQAAAD